MTIRDAVTAVFSHGRELFMVRRQPALKAFPGYHSFPGGKVDDDEKQTPPRAGLLADFPPRLAHALCRELHEELHYDLERAVQAGEVKSIHHLAVATTPDFHSHRFRTYFFKISLSRRPQFRVDESEAAAAGWFPLENLLQRYEAGRLLAVPPTVGILKGLHQDAARERLDGVDFVYDAAGEVPCFEVLCGLWQLPVPSKTLPPASRTNAFVIGDCLIDPSPRSDDELEKLLQTLRRFEMRQILLTHHHTDHYERAETLARRLNLPISLSEDSYTRILSRRGDKFFRGITLRFRERGETLTHWLGKAVKIWEVPGHDEGQLALAPDSMEWFLVGDLIQGIGTVVIAAPEGNMRKYFQSLEKVIALDPAVIIPSHGAALGTTFRLKETLKHRRKRERAVLELHRRGFSKRRMLGTIYAGLDLRLRPLAMANIAAHLAKLADEGRL